jgi:cysteine desulfurase
MDRIYLDHNATTPPDPAVREAMIKALETDWGNPSSMHRFGQRAGGLIEEARESVAALLGADPARIAFTSGGTEADNLAVIGAAFANSEKRRRIVTSAIEHPAVRAACARMKKHNFEVIETPVDLGGRVDLDAINDAINDRTVLVSVMAANNETGVIQPIEEIGRIARERGALFHTDAVQYAGKLPIDVKEWPVDLLSISAHKFYGPKGAGALWVGNGVKLNPRTFGGGQEMGIRTGTENVAGIAGLGAAASLVVEKLDAWNAHIGKLRNLLEEEIINRIEGALVNGDVENRVSNTTNVSFPGAEGEAVSINLDLKGVAVSTGSACASGATQASHALLAMGLPARRAETAIRFSLGKDNTEEEVMKALDALVESVSRVRSISGG